MTEEQARSIIAFLPAAPADSRFGWTPWEYDGGGQIASQVGSGDPCIFRFAYLQDERRGGRGLAYRIEISERVCELLMQHEVVRMARLQMERAQADLERMVPIYVAERIAETKIE